MDDSTEVRKCGLVRNSRFDALGDSTEATLKYRNSLSRVRYIFCSSFEAKLIRGYDNSYGTPHLIAVIYTSPVYVHDIIDLLSLLLTSVR